MFPANRMLTVSGNGFDVDENIINQTGMRETLKQKQIPVWNQQGDMILQKKPTYQAGYWDDPTRIGRYYQALQALPPGTQAPTWMDRNAIETAYQYYQAKNPNTAWYMWDYPDENDPVRQLTGNIPVPPPDQMPDNERSQFYDKAFNPSTSSGDTGYYSVPASEIDNLLTPSQKALLTKQGDNYLIPSEQFDALANPQQQGETVMVNGQAIPKEIWDQTPGWVQTAYYAMPWVNRAIQGGSGFLMGNAMGGPIVGGIMAAGQLGAGELAQQGYDPTTGKYSDNPAGWAARVMNWLNVGAENLEKGTGFLSQVMGAIGDPDKYGSIQEIMNDMNAAYQAGALTYEAGFADTFGGKVVSYGMGKPVEWQAPDNQSASAWTLTQARREISARIKAGESPSQVAREVQAKYAEKFGLVGQIKDMVGNMFLDPLNLLGDFENAGIAAFAKKAGNKPLADAAMMHSQIAAAGENFRRGMAGETPIKAGNMFANDPTDVVKLYGQMLRQLPVEDAMKYGAISKWIAGLDANGNIKELLPGQPANKNPIDYLFGLDPKSRATQVLNHSIEGIKTTLEGEDDPARIMAYLDAAARTNPDDVVRVLNGDPLPKWMNSAEAQALPLAMRDVVQPGHELFDQYRMTRPQAAALTRIAEAMGMEPSRLIADLHKATPDQATDLYRAFIQSMEKKAPTDKAAAKFLEDLRNDKSLTKLNGGELRNFAELFAGKDKAPFTVQEFKGRLFYLLGAGMEKWAVQNFNVKPLPWMIRLGETIKKVQSAALLGLNPNFFWNNSINNLITMAWDGLLRMNTSRSRSRWLREMGVKPLRLRAGASAKEVGDRFSAADLGGYQLGEQIRRAGRAGDTLTAISDLASGADKFAVFSILSEKMEMWSSEMATVNAMRSYWDYFWKEGKGLRKMPPELASMLDLMERGLSRKVMKAIERGKTKAQIDQIVFHDLGGASLRDVMTPEEADLMNHFPGLIDDMEAGLKNAVTDWDKKQVFQAARKKVADEINAAIQKNAAKITQETTHRVDVEGVQAGLDVYDQLMGQLTDFWLQHFQKMEAVADEARNLHGSARQALWQQATARADQEWNAFQNVEGSKWLGIFESLAKGKDQPGYTEAVSHLMSMHDNWADFYGMRKALMDRFWWASDVLDTGGSHPHYAEAMAWLKENNLRGVDEAWRFVNEQMNLAYEEATLREDSIQDELNILFSNLFAKQFPDRPDARASAMRWRDGIQKVRRQMMATMILYRNGGVLHQVPAEWLGEIGPEMTQRITVLTRALPPWALPVADRDAIAKQFYNDIYTPFIRGMMDASNGNPPGKPVEPAPVAPAPAALGENAGNIPGKTGENAGNIPNIPREPVRSPAPPEPAVTPAVEPAPAPTAAPVEAAPVTQPQPPTPQEIARANELGIFKIASEFGIGSDTAAGRAHILNALKMYLPIKNIDEVTPEMARDIFSDHYKVEGAEDLAANQLLKQRIAEYRAEVIRRNQAKLGEIAQASMTEEAFAKEAEAYLGESQSEAVVTVVNAIADHWAQENGKTRADWYDNFIFRRGGEGEGLAQDLQQAAGSKINGLTDWLDNGKAVVTAFESANVSTFVHEVAHVWLPQMSEGDRRIIETWLAAEYNITDLPAGWERGSKTYVEAKELFARGFERYLAEGRAPVPTMKKVFEKFKRWMVQIYQQITGSAIDVKLTPEINTLFDRWMGKKVEAVQVETPRPAPVEPAIAAAPVIKQAPATNVDLLKAGIFLRSSDNSFTFETEDGTTFRANRGDVGDTAVTHRTENFEERTVPLSSVVRVSRDDGVTVYQRPTGQISAQPRTSILERIGGTKSEPAQPAPIEADWKAQVEQALGMTLDEARAQLWRSKTGIGNETAFNMRLREIGGQEHYVIAADARGLKATNDTYGHEVGDMLLRAVAITLNDLMPDQAYHLHGDEYAGIVTGTLADANRIQDELQSRMRRIILEVQQDGQAQYVTGYGLHVGVGEDYAKADAASNAARAAIPGDRRLATQLTQLTGSGLAERLGTGAQVYAGRNGTVENITDTIRARIQQPTEPVTELPPTIEAIKNSDVIANYMEQNDLVAIDQDGNVIPPEVVRQAPQEELPGQPHPEMTMTPAVEPPAPARPAATIQRNAEKNGLEIKFPAKPDEQSLAWLHEHSYRWNRGDRVWYKRNPTDADFRAANERFGSPASPETTVPAATPEPTGPGGWPSFEQWAEGKKGDRYMLRNRYHGMVREAIEQGELGYEDGADLIGENAAKAAMEMRYRKMAQTLTQRQFIDASMPYVQEKSETPLIDFHRLAVEQAVVRGEAVPDEILRDYPALYLAKEPKTETPNVWTDPNGQGNLLEPSTGWGLTAETPKIDKGKAPENTPEGTVSLFGMEEYTNRPQIEAKKVEQSDFGPLFEQPPAAEPVLPGQEWYRSLKVGDRVMYQGKEYEINYYNGGGFARLVDPEGKIASFQAVASELKRVESRVEAPTPAAAPEVAAKPAEAAPQGNVAELSPDAIKMLDRMRSLNTDFVLKGEKYFYFDYNAANPLRKAAFDELMKHGDAVMEMRNGDPFVRLTDAAVNIPSVEDRRLQVRQALIDWMSDHPEADREALTNHAIEAYVNERDGFPGYAGGPEKARALLDDVMNMTRKPQPPVDTPITIQPNGIQKGIQVLSNLNIPDTFVNPRDFEKWAQQVFGLDMNEEENLNLAYDALEGAFNLKARVLRADLDSSGATLAERLEALANLESQMVRARRTISKMKLQQFSTPLSISEAAGFAADVRPGDVVGEPTAGTANLVDRFSQRGDVYIRVNELDPGRRKILSAIGYNPTGLNILSGDWVFQNGKKAGPWANVYIMNPPWGAYKTNKYGSPVNVPVIMNDWSQRFAYLTWQRVPEEGRMVMVMPTNWVYTENRRGAKIVDGKWTRDIQPNRSNFLMWLEHNGYLRAVIESPAGAYKERATDIGSLLVVVDKSVKLDKQPAIEAWGENAPKTWDEYAALVKELGEGGTHARENPEAGQSAVRADYERSINASRPASGPDATGLVDPAARAGKPEPDTARIGVPERTREPAAAEPRRPVSEPAGGAQPAQPIPGPRTVPGAAVGSRPMGEQSAPAPIPGTRTSGEPGVSGNGGPVQPAERSNTANVGAGTSDGWDLAPRVVEGQPGGISERVQPDNAGGAPTARPEPTEPGIQAQPTQRTEPTGQPAERYEPTAEDLAARKGQAAAIEQAGSFTLYVPRSPLGADEPRIAHPSTVVETKALSGVKAPDLKAEYRPSQRVMDAYKRGDLSLEGQLDAIWAAVQQNDENHSGFLVADDVGMGKSRTAAGFVLDRIDRGRKRILVVTADSRNVTNLMQNEFPAVSGGKFPAEMILLSGDTMPNVKKGGEPIPTFPDRPVVYFVNKTQLPAFTRQIIDLRIDTAVIDEVHMFKNFDTAESLGPAWNLLHQDWTTRPVSLLYLSATPGTDIADLEYLYGLKIWSMDGFHDWKAIITGEMSPDAAKRAQTARNELIKWADKVQEAVDQAGLVEKQGVLVDGVANYYTVDFGHGLIAVGLGNGEAGLRVVGRNFNTRYGLTTDVKNRLLMLGKYLIEAGFDSQTTDEYQARSMLLEAQHRFEADYPMPKVDKETIGNLGVKEASDALEGDKTKKKKWGAGRTAFETTILPAHTEQIMRELKVGGYYISRDISRQGVEFDVKKVDVDPEKLARHEKRIAIYRRIYDAFYKYGKQNKGPKRGIPDISGDIQADAKRSMFDLRLPGAIAEVDAALKRGEKVVISVVSVGDTDIEKGGNLGNALNKINTVKVDKIKQGGETTFTDPEDIPEALIEVEEIRDELRKLGPMESPIDILKRKYGDRIAFITGNENDTQRIRAQKDFQNDRIDIVLISKAGKTGINLHDITGRKRVHLITADYEWSATDFKQELGRVDRTGQKSNPFVTILHTGNAGELKFISTIANRMKGLGATSKGGAESTGTDALNAEFELGSEVDKYSLAQTWAGLSREEKGNFIEKWFNDPEFAGLKRRNIPATAEAIKKVTKALQSMTMKAGNDFVQMWMDRRKTLSEGAAEIIEARKAKARGEIIRSTPLGDNLILHEVKDQTGHRFGVISGVLTPHMHTLAEIMQAGRVDPNASWREWINFKDTATGEFASGLEIPPGRIERIAKEFGQAVTAKRSPETALQDMRAGDKLPVRGADNAEWELYLGSSGFREGKIIVSGARMADRHALMGNGAKFDARGTFFYVPEEILQDFLKRFPLRDAGGLAQAAQVGMTWGFGPSGERYQFRYKVVPLDDVVQSHTDTFDINPKYPSELQPRNRDRQGYKDQVTRIAQNLDEQALIETHQVATGTPIVGADNVVENGNGRIMGIRRARMDYPERWKYYQDYLKSHLEDYGLSEDDLNGIKDPVLVRERIGDTDRVKFANEAQASSSMDLNVDEQAAVDAKYVDNSALANLTINDDQTVEGALKSLTNRDLVMNFLSKIPEGQKNAFIGPDGELSLEGLTRLRNAIFAHVYPGEAGSRLAEAFLTTQSEATANIRAALFDTLGAVGQAEALIKEGRRDADLSIVDDIAKAVDVYARLKQQNASVVDYLAQTSLLGDELNPFQKALLGYINQHARSRRRLRELLALYADNVINTQTDPAQMSMFGGARSTKGEILDSAAQTITGQEAGFAEAQPQPAQVLTPEPDFYKMFTQEQGTPPATPAEETVQAPPEPAAATPETAVPAPATPPQAVNSPLGTGDTLREPPIEEAAMESWMKDIGPLLDRTEKAYLSNKNRKTGIMDLEKSADPKTKQALRAYLGGVYADLADTKLGMMRYGEGQRDAALLNYSRRTGLDNWLQLLMPYEFWYTRSMLNWAARAITRPNIIAKWARLRGAQSEEDQPGYPTRLKGKTAIRAPFLPGWMGGALYTDPLRQIFPFEQLARPWEAWTEQNNLESRKIETVLNTMVEDGEITEAEAQQALQTKTGSLWERASATARNQMDNYKNPLDFAFMMSGPSLPVSLAYSYATGRQSAISQLPVTKLIQNVTSAIGVGGPRGVNIEAGIRKAAGLPEVDQYDDYRIDRMLANLTAEGQISADDAKRAMIDRQGPAFDLANKRVAEMGRWAYFGAPLGVDMFPEGEQEMRALKTEYDKARARWAGGDKKALTKFYELHPEYTARAASFQEPEPRLRNYLISEVWTGYRALPDLYKKQINEQLGPEWTDAFLDSETRSYDSISTQTLAMWARMFKQSVPNAAPESPKMNLDLADEQTATAVQEYNDARDKQFPQIGEILSMYYGLTPEQQKSFKPAIVDKYYKWRDQYLAGHPSIIPWVTSEQSELSGLPNDVQAYVYNYRAAKEQQFPGIEQTQEQYFTLNGQQRRGFLKQHPELSEYWTWRRQMAAAQPKAAAYILSETSMQKAILGEDYIPPLDQQTLQQMSPELLRALAAHVYTGRSLGAGAWGQLEPIWESLGKPGGTIEVWLDKAVVPALQGSGSVLQ